MFSVYSWDSRRRDGCWASYTLAGHTLRQIAAMDAIPYRRACSINSDEFLGLLREFGVHYLNNSVNQTCRQRVLDVYGG